MPALNVSSLVPNKDYLIYNSHSKRAIKIPRKFINRTSDGFLYFNSGTSRVGFNPKFVQIYNVNASDYPANISSAPVGSSSAAPSAPVSSSSAAASAPISSTPAPAPISSSSSSSAEMYAMNKLYSGFSGKSVPSKYTPSSSSAEAYAMNHMYGGRRRTRKSRAMKRRSRKHRRHH